MAEIRIYIMKLSLRLGYQLHGLRALIDVREGCNIGRFGLRDKGTDFKRIFTFPSAFIAAGSFLMFDATADPHHFGVTSLRLCGKDKSLKTRIHRLR
ncbi:MAG: hypothetical protein JWR15_4453 [Prosthecobacter sp.]|nr:hypothetical protein [Prosthecobacter sp.]